MGNVSCTHFFEGDIERVGEFYHVHPFIWHLLLEDKLLGGLDHHLGYWLAIQFLPWTTGVRYQWGVPRFHSVGDIGFLCHSCQNHVNILNTMRRSYEHLVSFLSFL